jgi:hypothetical protein
MSATADHGTPLATGLAFAGYAIGLDVLLLALACCYPSSPATPTPASGGPVPTRTEPVGPSRTAARRTRSPAAAAPLPAPDRQGTP